MSDKQKTSSWLGSGLLCAGLVLIFVGERVVGQGVGRNVTSGLGAVLMLVACGLRVNAWSGAKDDVRGVEARLLAAYGGAVVAMGLYALSTDASLTLMHLRDATKDHVESVLAVLWPAVLTVALTALLFMELVYARMPIVVSVELRRVRTASYAGLSLALCAVFLLSMNYVVTARDVRKDLSYFKTTEPSGATKHMIAKLEVPVKAILFYRHSDDVLQQVEPYFATLARQSKKFTYKVLDSAFVPELCHKHRINGNGAVLLLQGEGDNQKGEHLQIGTDLMQARRPLRKLDGLFQQQFAKLARPPRAVALTVGHGEFFDTRAETVKPGDGTNIMLEVLRRLNIKTNKLGLAQGLGTAVPDGSGAVIVMGAHEKFMPEEVQTLLSYVYKGGRLMLMIDPGADDGLDPLLAGIGLKRLPGTVLSEKDHLNRVHDNTDKALIFSNHYSSHPTVTTAARFQNQVASVFVSGVGLQRDLTAARKPKPSVTFPLRTGTDFYRDLDGDFEHDANEGSQWVNLVAAVSVPQSKDHGEGRVVVIGDGDFMTDKVAGNNGNAMLFVDSLAWLIGNEELNAEVSSEEDIPIQHSRDKDKLWFYATTFGVPLPLLGLAAWVSRRRRRPSEASA